MTKSRFFVLICPFFKIILRKKYSYKYTNNHTSIFIWISVIIPIKIVDYFINTIDDIQIEKDFFYHCNVIVYIHDFEIVFWKIDDDTLEFVVLDNNVHLYEIDYHTEKFSSVSIIIFEKLTL